MFILDVIYSIPYPFRLKKPLQYKNLKVVSS